jgi:hypothetical protein
MVFAMNGKKVPDKKRRISGGEANETLYVVEFFHLRHEG